MLNRSNLRLMPVTTYDTLTIYMPVYSTSYFKPHPRWLPPTSLQAKLDGVCARHTIEPDLIPQDNFKRPLWTFMNLQYNSSSKRILKHCPIPLDWISMSVNDRLWWIETGKNSAGNYENGLISITCILSKGGVHPSIQIQGGYGMWMVIC